MKKNVMIVIGVATIMSSAFAADRYVSLNGAHIPPFTNWASAATGIQYAISVCSSGDVVWVTNGTYEVGEYGNPYDTVKSRISITNAVAVYSMNGAMNTIIRGGTPIRGVWMGSNSALRGFTVRGANLAGSSDPDPNGAGLAAPYGRWTTKSPPWSEGDWLPTNVDVNAKIYDCIIRDNLNGKNGGGTKGVAVFYNCLFTGNTSVYGGGGACDGVFYNCVAFDNSSGIRYGYVYNSIMWDNAGDNYPEAYLIANSCSPGLTGNNITNDPLFVDPANNDFRLQAASPCINAGTNQVWMITATDLDGNSRIIYDVVDMGAYEYSGSVSSVLAAPTGVSATDGAYSNKIGVVWNSVAGALYYEVWRNASNNVSAASFLAQTTNGASYDDMAVIQGVTYYYWVKSVNAQTSSVFSSPDSGYVSYAASAGNADLSLMTLLFLPATLTTNQHPGAVSAQLINYGPMNLTSPNTRVAVDMYLSANTNFGDGDDICIGDYTSDQTVGASSYTTVVVPASGRQGLTVPTTVTAGTYYVFARVRHAYPSTLADPDESNNYVMREGAITVVTDGSGGDTEAGYHLINDYDGDGKSDLAVYQETTGKWEVMLSGSGYQSVGLIFGGSGYDPVIADYDGDGKSDPAIYRQSTGEWKVMLSKQDYTVETATFGGSGYAPVPADFDGDGLADPIIYQEATGLWTILLSGTGYAAITVELGGNGYNAVPADYDGDAKTDLAVYRRSSGDWYFKFSTLDYFTMTAQFGGAGRLPVPADFDGDGKADPAVYKENSGEWSVMMSKYNYMVAQAVHGGNGYLAVPADYDGDGKGDVVVYNENAGLLKILLSGQGYAQTEVEGIGGPGYDPVGVVK